MAQPDTRPSMRAAAIVMRSTADRFDAILDEPSLTEAEVLRRLELEAGDLYRAMATLDRELGEPPD